MLRDIILHEVKKTHSKVLKISLALALAARHEEVVTLKARSMTLANADFIAACLSFDIIQLFNHLQRNLF